MNALDGTGKKNLSNNGLGVNDPSPLLARRHEDRLQSYGKQTSNPEGDNEVYVMNALDGTGKKNLTNNGAGVDDYLPVFSPDGTRVAYRATATKPPIPRATTRSTS